MSGECDDCGEHCLECRCMEDIKVWVQAFFPDGSVSEGKRIPAEWLEEKYSKTLACKVWNMISYLNREEGYILIWGAGNMRFLHYPTSFLSQESDSSASSPESA